jgi:hypothetical protein
MGIEMEAEVSRERARKWMKWQISANEDSSVGCERSQMKNSKLTEKRKT